MFDASLFAARPEHRCVDSERLEAAAPGCARHAGQPRDPETGISLGYLTNGFCRLDDGGPPHHGDLQPGRELRRLAGPRAEPSIGGAPQPRVGSAHRRTAPLADPGLPT